MFSPDDSNIPVNPYAISKFESENGLIKISKESDMKIAIIRPPFVYGVGVKANFLVMMKWLNRGIPMPFKSIDNKRSLVYLDNLVDFIITCIGHPAAKNQISLFRMEKTFQQQSY